MIPHSRLLSSAFVASHLNGYANVPIDIDADVALDLDAAALEEDDPMHERARLRTRRFVHGRHRRWVCPGDTNAETARADQVLSLTIHQFASATEAALSVADLRERLIAAAVRVATEGTWILAQYTGDPPDTAVRCASGAVGAFQVVAVSSTSGPCDVLAIAQAQAELLANA